MTTMGYFLKTKSGLKGPVEPPLIQRLFDEGRLREESTVVDADGISYRVSAVLGMELDDDLSDFELAEPVYEEPAYEEPAYEEYPAEEAPRRAPQRGRGAGVASPRGGHAPGRGRGALARQGSLRSRALRAGHITPNKLHYATISLQISMVLYGLIALGCFLMAALFSQGDPGPEMTADEQSFMVMLGVFMGVFCAALLIPLALLVSALKRRKPTAWIFGVIAGVLYVTSAFFPLGIFILIGLFDRGTKKEFGQ